MDLKRFLAWKKSRAVALKTHFFDDIFIEDEKLQNDIIDWISRLKYSKNISINRLSELFSKFEIIAFPIKVSGCPHHLQIKDNIGKEYYLNYFQLDYTKIEEYSIGRRAYPLDREFVYHLTPQKEIALKELLILQLNEDNKNTDNLLAFHYNTDSSVTTAILKTKTQTLELAYPSQKYMQDNEISMYLLNLAGHFAYFDDVSFILVYISDILKPLEEKYSLLIKSYMNTDNEKKLLSEILVSNGIVTQYSFTTRSTYSEVCLNQKVISEDLEQFILSHKN